MDMDVRLHKFSVEFAASVADRVTAAAGVQPEIGN